MAGWVKRAWRARVRSALALAATAALGPALADVYMGGDVTPEPIPGVDYYPGTIFRLGHLEPGDFGVIEVNRGSYLTAGGVRVHSGGLLVHDPLTFLELSGADRSLWVGHGGNGFAHVYGGAQLRATGGCGIGHCGLVVGGTTGGRFEFPPGSLVPVTLETGAKGDLLVWGTGSRLTMDGTLRVGQAWVGTGGIPDGTRDGGAVGVVQVFDGAEMTTGQALLAIGPSGPGAGGHEQAHAYVSLDTGARWNIVRNATSDEQALLRLGVAGDTGLAGDHLNGGVGVFGGSRLFIDGRSGGANPGIVAAGAGPTSYGFLHVNGAGSEIVIAGDTGFINLGGHAGTAGGFANLRIDGGAQVRGLDEHDLVFVNVGRNGFDARGELVIDGRDAQGTRSQLTLSGRGGPLGGSAGQGAFLSIGRGGADGEVSLSNGGRLYVGAGYYNDGLTTSGAGFALARDVGSTGRLSIHGAGSELYVFSGDAPAFGAIGQAGLGEVYVAAGGTLQLLGGPLDTPRTHRLLVGGGTANVGHGLLDVQGAGSLVNVGFVDDHLLLVGSGASGSTGRVLMRDGAELQSTVAAFGQGSGNLGQLHLDRGATVTLSGVMSQGASSGAALLLGLGGGRGEAVLQGSGTRLTIDSVGSFAGVVAGGTSAQPGGQGQLRLFDGARLQVVDRGRFDHGLILGRLAGGADVLVNGASLEVDGAGRIVVGAVPDSTGLLEVVSGASVHAGRLLLVAGQELPDAVGGGLVHANGWAPLPVNLDPPAGSYPASGLVKVEIGATLRTAHLGVALQPGSLGTVVANRGGRLEVGASAMVGAVGLGKLELDAATLTVAGDAARLVFGGAAGSRGDLWMAGAAQAGVLGPQASMVLGQAGTGTGTVGGGSRLVVRQDGPATLTPLVLGAAAGAEGGLRITGIDSVLQVTGGGAPAVVRIGQQGSGQLWVDAGSRLEATQRAEAGLHGVLALGGSPASLLHALDDSHLALAGRGNYLVVEAGRATLEGRIDLSLTGAPTGAWALPRLAPGASQTTLSASAPLITLKYDGYTPVRGDLVTLLSAQDIVFGDQALISAYSRTSLDGRPAYEFSLGQDRAVFRIEAPANGLYPALERVKVDGNDLLGLRFVDQALFLDFDNPTTTRVDWKLNAETGVYHPVFGAEGSGLGHGLLDAQARRDIVAGVQARLWGDEPAWTFSDGSGARLGDAVPIPVFVSTAAGQAAPANAVAVRFAAPNLAPGCSPECRYQSYQGYANDTVGPGNRVDFDFRNGRKDGEVLVFGDQATAGADTLAWIAVHEVGHALGLVHTYDPAVDGDNLMSFVGGTQFSDQPMRMTEPPQAGGQPYIARQNAMLHLLRYTFGWSEQDVRRFGGVPGELDDPNLALDEELVFYYDLSGAFGGLQDLTLMLPERHAAGDGGWAPARSLDVSDGAVSFALIAGTPFYVVGSSGEDGVWDVFFKSDADPTRSGVAGEAAGIGSVLRLDLASGAWVDLGDYGYAAAPVPEPAGALMLLGGLALLAGLRRRSGR